MAFARARASWRPRLRGRPTCPREYSSSLPAPRRLSFHRASPWAGTAGSARLAPAVVQALALIRGVDVFTRCELYLMVTGMKPKGSMKPMKKKKTEEPELEPLCCCEYIDRNGEKNHMAACLCDCQDLDEGCDRAKKNPGYLSSPASNATSLSSSQIECLNKKGQEKTKGFLGADPLGSLNSRAVKDDLKSSSRVSAGSPTKAKEDWCAKCQLVRPARAWHCRICGICVRRMDHHCVWINSCVGESNHQAFILALLIFLLTSVYGITLTLDTICRDRSVFTALFYCPGVYSNYSSALSFTCVWYSVTITAGMAYIFLIQLINISYNVTEREVQQALRQKTGRRLLWGLIVDTGQYNRGFLRNWHQFSTLGTSTLHHPAEDIV
ncbi:palmitoyltransferase ZDHHC23 isoform X5 [Cavia porcellus]|uniref:palmitoyltransferase ZDHHC23 isoform X5 n=1 Tax=Cavia porcellus TaxID=10141 RepID=UPI000661EF38|nr:palmitoyltransferase ZDHHC23 isoform X4 [Cavia porcellus]